MDRPAGREREGGREPRRCELRLVLSPSRKPAARANQGRERKRERELTDRNLPDHIVELLPSEQASKDLLWIDETVLGSVALGPKLVVLFSKSRVEEDLVGDSDLLELFLCVGVVSVLCGGGGGKEEGSRRREEEEVSSRGSFLPFDSSPLLLVARESYSLF